ncbi:MAG: hypothetical protein ABL982_18430 [Vicinamibacterales bacterium]
MKSTTDRVAGIVLVAFAVFSLWVVADRGYAGFLIFLPRALAHRQPVSTAAAQRYLTRRRRPEVLTGG